MSDPITLEGAIIAANALVDAVAAALEARGGLAVERTTIGGERHSVMVGRNAVETPTLEGIRRVQLWAGAEGITMKCGEVWDPNWTRWLLTGESSPQHEVTDAPTLTFDGDAWRLAGADAVTGIVDTVLRLLLRPVTA